MDFDLDDEQRGLIDALSTLLARHAGPQRAREVAAASGYDEELMGALVEAGYADVREVGAGPLEAVLVTEIVAREAGCAPIGWRALVAKLDLMTGEEPSVPRKFRMAFRDRRYAREAVSKVLSWPTEKVLIAHGAPVTAGGEALLRCAFRWLMK